MDPILVNKDFNSSYDNIFVNAIVATVEFDIEVIIHINRDEFDQIVADIMAELVGKCNTFLFLSLRNGYSSPRDWYSSPSLDVHEPPVRTTAQCQQAATHTQFCSRVEQPRILQPEVSIGTTPRRTAAVNN
jgi:hypothetical protein